MLLQLLFKLYWRSFQDNQARKKNERHPDWKEVQVASGMILYIENPNKSIKKLLELMSIYIRTNKINPVITNHIIIC